MDKTNKGDWLTRYLHRKNFWVGGTRVEYNSDPLTAATQTIRYFHATKPEFLIVYILEFVEPQDLNLDYSSAIEFYLTQSLLKPDFTLAIWPHNSLSFAVLEGGNFRQNLNAKNALLEFEKFDPALIGRSSNLKPLNRSYTDFFHLWARQNMKGFQNDIDAFVIQDQKIHMLELKRPKESTSTWKPYRADAANYFQFASLCSRMSYQLTNIAYTEAERGKMKIFRDVTFSNQRLNYETADLVINPDDEILLAIKNLNFQKESSAR